ncbi:TetR/AcrR family transcriptional regulator [Pseudomaricurvus sp.]|uniref:TetR/AcrR family transcriptional regulator n=1 Tax=Pseudomaricurvus sp. TaxID=2004510 RepID=UPI003F6B42DE
MTSPSVKNTASGKTTQKFHKKRELILDAAAELINQVGIKGMTFVEVAKLVGLNTTSVTYYFKRKEQLAAAALERSLTALEGLIEQASQAPDPRARVKLFIQVHCELRADIRLRRTSPLAALTDLRALEDPHQTQLLSRYYKLFDGVEAFFPKPKNAQDQFLYSARAHILLNTMLWLPAWSVPYSISDFPRVQQRLFELFEQGLLPENQQVWQPQLLTQNEAELDSGQDGIPDQFLRAATSLINELGYRGASVERISSELNVTKGSFYHHLPTKDDLVRECFRHSYHRITLIQRDASAIKGNYWHKLSSVLATLLNIQLSSEFPLLKPTAWQPLPRELRTDIQLRTDRYAQRFSSFLIDGITDGSLRPIDPLLTAQVIIYMLNAAYDLRQHLNELSPEQAVELYASALTRGLFY